MSGVSLETVGDWLLTMSATVGTTCLRVAPGAAAGLRRHPVCPTRSAAAGAGDHSGE